MYTCEILQPCTTHTQIITRLHNKLTTFPAFCSFHLHLSHHTNQIIFVFENIFYHNNVFYCKFTLIVILSLSNSKMCFFKIFAIFFSPEIYNRRCAVVWRCSFISSEDGNNIFAGEKIYCHFLFIQKYLLKSRIAHPVTIKVIQSNWTQWLDYGVWCVDVSNFLHHVNHKSLTRMPTMTHRHGFLTNFWGWIRSISGDEIKEKLTFPIFRSHSQEKV